MSKAICFKCGLDKSSPFDLCAACGERPLVEDDIAVSMVLSADHYSDEQLAALSLPVRAGRQPLIRDELLRQAKDALKDPQLRSLLGLDSAGNVRPAPGRPLIEPVLLSNDVKMPAAVRARVRSDAPHTTTLHRNPFYLLGATTRDNSRRIVALADGKSLSLDSDVCAKARIDLTNPRNRLAVEVAWMPGVSPTRASTLVSELNAHLTAILRLSNTPILARTNLMAAGLELLDSEMDTTAWADWILQIGQGIDEIDPTVVMRAVNEDREVAGFPPILALQLVEDELVVRRRDYKDSIKNAINRLSPLKLVEVISRVVNAATKEGTQQAPVLIDELVDAYELETQQFLQHEADIIQKLVESAVASAPKGGQVVEPLIDRLNDVVQNWGRVAKPIQMSMMSRGLDHAMSLALAWKIRGLGIDLHNEHVMYAHGQRITNLLQAVFADIPSVVEKLREDNAAIADFAREREKTQRQVTEWEQSITFRAELGLVFKDELAISARGLQWKNQLFPLNSVTRVRWGATRHSINGIPTGTKYTLGFGDQHSLAVVETTKKDIYGEFQSRLWKAVADRLLTAMLRGLREGRKYQFGDLILDDAGAEMTKHKTFGADMRVYGKWSQVHVWSENGSFVVGMQDDKKTFSAMSYLETDNVHLLEVAIRAKFKNGNPRLSSILD